MDHYVVKVKHCNNSDKFRQAAIRYEKFGYYTSAPPGTTAFMQYWDEELKRSIHGYVTEDGDYITGYFYFYLNYSRIIITKEVQVEDKLGRKRKDTKRTESFPIFYDYDRSYFDTIEEAERSGTHLVTIKKRGSGYSYKGASMMCRNFYCIPSSRSVAVASEAEFLTKDGILTKAWDMMGFIDIKTAWGKKRQKKDTIMHKRASFVFEDDTWGIKSEQGWGSEIMGVTLKNDPQKARGKRAKLILFEESGKFPNLRLAWGIARPSVETDSGIAFGLMICYGTGGTLEADYEGLKDLFYNPLSFNALPIENVWDDGGAGQNCGFFVPQYYNMEGYDKKGLVEKGRHFMDENGNSDIEFSKQFGMASRNIVIENSSNRSTIDSFIAERPSCLHGDTWVSVEGIHKNVELQRIKNVIDKYDNGIQDLYKVTTENNRELICTKTHHIYDGKNYKPLSEYKVGNNVKTLSFYFSNVYQCVKIKYPIADLSFDLKIDEDWAKFIGLFMGDGHFYSRKYTNELGFALDIKDVETVDWIKSFVKKMKFGNVQQRTIGNMIKLRVNNKDLLDLFKQLDLIERNGNERWKRNVHIPEYIIKSPKTVVCSFLSGLYDSDGSITKNTGIISFYTKYEEFSRDVIMLLTGLGIYPKYSNITRINSNGRNYQGRKIDIRKIHNLIFLRDIGFISNRKQQILENNLPVRNLDKDWSFDIIKSIECWGKDRVYNMQTDTKYYSANGIHTHNSPVEATLQISGNIFPKKDLIRHLANIRMSTKLSEFKQVGDLGFNEQGLISWEIGTQYKDLTKWKLNPKDDPAGAIVIWEHPPEDVPYGLYVMGCDPYDHDQSGTNSLGSVIVYKRIQHFEEYMNLPVAEYTGRPDTADEFYEKVRRLALYFNAKILYENEKKGLFSYFSHKHCEHMLAAQPDIIKDIVQNSKVQRGYGVHMNAPIKDWGEGLIKDWLIEEFDTENRKMNLTKIFSEPLLEELIAYNPDGNFDRVMAFMMVMIMIQELHHVNVKKKKNLEKNVLFKHGIFREEERLVI